jgi:hypothetical protein
MKKFHFVLVVIITIVSAVVYSCKKKDPCEGVTCPANKVCSSGTCTCPFGYEGANCDTVSAEKFIGSYRVTENCQNPAGPGYTYNTQIISSFRHSEVTITDVLGSGISINALVDGNTIYINEQTVSGLRIVGEGFYQPINRTLQINYEYNFSGSSRSCTAFFQRF